MEFIVALSQLLLSFAGARWYFSHEDEGKRSVASPVLGSLFSSLRYHVGSLAFGSFLVALLQFAQAVLDSEDKNEGISAFIEKRAPQWKGR